MKKNAFMKVLTVLLLISLVVGCTPKETASTEVPKEEISTVATEEVKETVEEVNEGETKTEKVKIKFWTKGSGINEAFEKKLQDYNASQDQIEIVNESYGDNYESVVNLGLNSGSAADIIEVTGNLSVKVLAMQEQLIPIEDLITSDYRKELHPSALKQQDFYFNKLLYAIPTRIDSYRLLYNKELFEKAGLDPNSPPTTLEEMREMAKVITEAGKGEFYGFGLPLGVGNIWSRTLDSIAIAMGRSGQYSFDFKKGEFDFALSKDIFNYFVEVGKDGSLFPGYQTLTIDPLRANFAAGKIAMYIDGSWMSGVYATQIKTEQDWDAAPVPIFEGYERAKDWAYCGVPYSITASSENIPEAKEALKKIIEWSSDQTVNPAPRVYVSANDITNLPIEQLGLKGVEVLFNTTDLAILPIEPHRFIALQGDNRDKMFTEAYISALTDDNFDLSSVIETLDERYNAALTESINAGNLTIEEVKLPDFDYLKSR